MARKNSRGKSPGKGRRTRKISVDDAISMAVEAHKGGLIEEAQSVYNDILQVDPDQPDALHYLGVIAHQLGDGEKAISLIEKSISINPNQPDALNNLGNVYKELGQLENAKNAYNRVLELAPEHPDTLVNIGIILRQFSKPKESIGMFLRALEADPEHGDAHHNLGNSYSDLKDFDKAIKSYELASKYSGNVGRSPVAMANALYRHGKKAEAVQVLQRHTYAMPDDAVARHALAAYSGRNIPKRASDQYVRKAFDEFSRSFDEVLTKLDYRAPKLIGDLVGSTFEASNTMVNVLDIGCGTGLCGPHLRPIAAQLTGVDLSSGMLAKARQRNVYDALEEAELTRFMQKKPASYDVITCVDTLCYLGDLSQAIPAAFEALNRSGWFFFTVEQHTSAAHSQAYWLQLNGRYSHRKSYLQSLLGDAGFEIRNLDEVTLRYEGSDKVSGLLVGAEKLG
jgi:predicted TPR repeat methyltransferase